MLGRGVQLVNLEPVNLWEVFQNAFGHDFGYHGAACAHTRR